MNSTGWKTYLAAAISILYGIFIAYYFKDLNQSAIFVIFGLSLLGVRSALTKIIKRLWMEFAGLILIGIGANTFINSVWLILYNAQNKRIERLENLINKLLIKE